MARVGVAFGGRTVEHQVSIRSARTVIGALEEIGHKVVPLGIAQDGCWLEPGVSQRAVDGDLDSLEAVGEPLSPTLRHLLDSSIEVLFPVVHGTWGEDGTLQGLCEMLDLPYVGAGVGASALAMDKVLCKRQLESCGLPVVEYGSISRSSFQADPERALKELPELPFPLFVKPSVGGSSVGVRKIEAPEELQSAIAFALRFDTTALIERGVPGRELECSVLGDLHLKASAVGEIRPGNPFYDYEDKYLLDAAELEIPADLPASVTEQIRSLAVESFAAVGGHGMARVDFLLEGDAGLYINEINTLPGFTSISMYPKLWEEAGLSLPELVDRLVEIAISVHHRRRSLDEGIKDWLAQLGG
ncbi:MAG: D-alanine--D-alanine ligase family protein [Thermoanaerobaculia bacterium]